MIYTPFVWLLLASAFVNGSLAHYTRRYQDVPSVRPFRILMWIVTAWALLYGVSISIAVLPLKLFIVNVIYIPSVFSTLASFALALEYTGHGQWLTRRRLILLLVMPVVFLIFAFTSQRHQLWRYDYQLHWSGSVPVIVATKGAIYWAYIVYMLGLSFTTFAILVTSFQYRTLYFRNTIVLTIGMLIPIVIGILYVFGLTPVRGFDWLPVSFIWMGVLYIWAVLRGRLFDVVPIARNMLIDNMEELMIALNSGGFIIDYNRAAQTALALSPPVIGASPSTLSQPWAEIFQHHADTASRNEEAVIADRTYELTISPIHNDQAHNLGRLFLFHDITNRKQAEIEERKQRTLAEALRETSHVLNSTLDYDSVLEKILINVGRVVPIDSANIALLDNLGTLHYVRFFGYKEFKVSEDELKEINFSLDTSSIFKRVYETGQPLIIPDTHANPEWVITSSGAWIRSHAVMPIRIKDRVVGFLNLDSAVLGMYTPEHIHNLRAFADQAAIAVENARLFATAEHEITERRQVEEKLRQLSRAVEQSPASIIITDTSGKIEYVNPRFTEITGYSAEEVIGQNPRILKTEKTSPETHSQLWETISSGREWRGEFINRRKNGEEYYEATSISPIVNERGIITHYLAVKEDITKRKKAEEDLHQANRQLQLQLEAIQKLQAELREQAIRDPLTGLYNRRYLTDALDRELARAERGGHPISFVMIDIDHFKRINDTFGHDAGDSILQKLAAMIQGQTRIGDIVCRYGGEEIIAILPDVTAQIAFQITDRWRKVFMGSTLPLEFGNATATISCGISEYPAHGSVAAELITLADKAMYQAKAAGRNRVIVWNAKNL